MHLRPMCHRKKVPNKSTMATEHRTVCYLLRRLCRSHIHLAARRYNKTIWYCSLVFLSCPHGPMRSVFGTAAPTTALAGPGRPSYAS